MSADVKRYRVNTLPGRITRDCPEVVLAFDHDATVKALKDRVSELERELKETQVALRNAQVKSGDLVLMAQP